MDEQLIQKVLRGDELAILALLESLEVQRMYLDGERMQTEPLFTT